MNFTYMIIGMLFLLNPTVNIIDVLPDFVGYAFIIRSMMKYSSICDDFKTSYSNFKALLWLSLAKIPCLAIYFIINDNDRVWLLLISFCFGIFDILFGVKAFAALFDGLAYCAMRTDASNYDLTDDNAVPKLSRGVFNDIDFMRKFTLAFVVLKTALCVLPEFTLLSSENYGEVTPDGIRSIARFRPFFIAASVVVVLAFGVYWFIKIKAYFTGVKADTEYVAQLKEKYVKYTTENSFDECRKRLFFSISMLILGFVFFITLNTDGFDSIPKALGATMLAIAFLSLSKILGKSSRSAFGKSVIFAVVSFAIWIYQLFFVMSFFKDQLTSNDEGLAVPFAYALQYVIQRSFTSYYLFLGSCALSVAEAILMIILLLSAKKVIHELISNYTGVGSIRQDSPDTIADTKALHHSLSVNLNASIILGIISAITASLQLILTITLPIMWFIDALIRGVFIIISVVLLVRIKDSIKSKYFIE